MPSRGRGCRSRSPRRSCSSARFLASCASRPCPAPFGGTTHRCARIGFGTQCRRAHWWRLQPGRGCGAVRSAWYSGTRSGSACSCGSSLDEERGGEKERHRLAVAARGNGRKLRAGASAAALASGSGAPAARRAASRIARTAPGLAAALRLALAAARLVHRRRGDPLRRSRAAPAALRARLDLFVLTLALVAPGARHASPPRLTGRKPETYAL